MLPKGIVILSAVLFLKNGYAGHIPGRNGEGYNGNSFVHNGQKGTTTGAVPVFGAAPAGDSRGPSSLPGQVYSNAIAGSDRAATQSASSGYTGDRGASNWPAQDSKSHEGFLRPNQPVQSSDGNLPSLSSGQDGAYPVGSNTFQSGPQTSSAFSNPPPLHQASSSLGGHASAPFGSYQQAQQTHSSAAFSAANSFSAASIANDFSAGVSSQSVPSNSPVQYSGHSSVPQIHTQSTHSSLSSPFPATDCNNNPAALGGEYSQDSPSSNPNVPFQPAASPVQSPTFFNSPRQSHYDASSSRVDAQVQQASLVGVNTGYQNQLGGNTQDLNLGQFDAPTLGTSAGSQASNGESYGRSVSATPTFQDFSAPIQPTSVPAKQHGNDCEDHPPTVNPIVSGSVGAFSESVHNNPGPAFALNSAHGVSENSVFQNSAAPSTDSYGGPVTSQQPAPLSNTAHLSPALAIQNEGHYKGSGTSPTLAPLIPRGGNYGGSGPSFSSVSSSSVSSELGHGGSASFAPVSPAPSVSNRENYGANNPSVSHSSFISNGQNHAISSQHLPSAASVPITKVGGFDEFLPSNSQFPILQGHGGSSPIPDAPARTQSTDNYAGIANGQHHKSSNPSQALSPVPVVPQTGSHIESGFSIAPVQSSQPQSARNYGGETSSATAALFSPSEGNLAGSGHSLDFAAPTKLAQDAGNYGGVAPSTDASPWIPLQENQGASFQPISSPSSVGNGGNYGGPSHSIPSTPSVSNGVNYKGLSHSSQPTPSISGSSSFGGSSHSIPSVSSVNHGGSSNSISSAPLAPSSGNFGGSSHSTLAAPAFPSGGTYGGPSLSSAHAPSVPPKVSYSGTSSPSSISAVPSRGNYAGTTPIKPKGGSNGIGSPSFALSGTNEGFHGGSQSQVLAPSPVSGGNYAGPTLSLPAGNNHNGQLGFIPPTPSVSHKATYSGSSISQVAALSNEGGHDGFYPSAPKAPSVGALPVAPFEQSTPSATNGGRYVASPGFPISGPTHSTPSAGHSSNGNKYSVSAFTTLQVSSTPNAANYRGPLPASRPAQPASTAHFVPKGAINGGHGSISSDPSAPAYPVLSIPLVSPAQGTGYGKSASASPILNQANPTGPTSNFPSATVTANRGVYTGAGTSVSSGNGYSGFPSSPASSLPSPKGSGSKYGGVPSRQVSSTNLSKAPSGPGYGEAVAVNSGGSFTGGQQSSGGYPTHSASPLGQSTGGFGTSHYASSKGPYKSGASGTHAPNAAPNHIPTSTSGVGGRPGSYVTGGYTGAQSIPPASSNAVYSSEPSRQTGVSFFGAYGK